MTEHDDNVREAQRLLASRVEDMNVYLAAAENGVDVYDDSEWDFDGEWFTSDASTEQLVDLGPLGSSYGLSWEKEITNHRTGTVTYAHVLSTGGPHDEFRVEFGERGKVESVTYVYLPWFDRVEIPLYDDGKYVSLNADVTGEGDRVDTVVNFYESFYGDYVAEESER